MAGDEVWRVDSTTVECARSREAVARSDLAGGAEYGFCASPAPASSGAAPAPVHHRPRAARAGYLPVPQAVRAGRKVLIAEENYYCTAIGADLAGSWIELLRPARQGEPPRPGDQFFKAPRQIIESVNDTLKGQLDPERHGGRTVAGICARITQTTPGHDRRHLAHRPPRIPSPLPDRLRRLTSLGLIHL